MDLEDAAQLQCANYSWVWRLTKQLLNVDGWYEPLCLVRRGFIYRFDQ